MKQVESVLIIDDNRGDAYLLEYVLRETGRFPNIYSARTGEEAIQMFRDYEESRRRRAGTFPPLLIFLDINMPRMDGFEFLDEYTDMAARGPIGDEPPSVIVMVTSSADPRDRARALEYPAVKDLTTKPVEPADAIAIAERFGAPVTPAAPTEEPTSPNG